MPAQGFAVFQTAIGPCGVAWGPCGIVGVQLPERSESATRERLRRRHPDAAELPPPADVQRAIDGVVALLRGEQRDLSDVALDMAGIAAFRQRLYRALRAVPAGATITYGELAGRLGDGCTARDIGEAMGQNPFPIIVPCHRVMASGGKVGGFSAAGGVVTKLRLLNIEGAQVGAPPALFGALPLSVSPRRTRQQRTPTEQR